MDPKTLKDAAIEVIKAMPAAATLEEIMYQINMVAHVIEGLKDMEDNKVIGTSDLLKEVDLWQ